MRGFAPAYGTGVLTAVALQRAQAPPPVLTGGSPNRLITWGQARLSRAIAPLAEAFGWPQPPPAARVFTPAFLPRERAA